MPTRESMPQEDPRLVRALEEYRAALEAGRRPDRGEFLTLHPEIAEVLAECLDGLEFVYAAAPHLSGVDSGPPQEKQATPDMLPGGPLGDFRILREVGRGGMGVVYEAEQLSLARRVALKVLPFAATMDPRQLQRFHNEARAAAGLHHPNIVPVYAVGSERGVHYYAMQLIEGQTLAAAIDALRREAGLHAAAPGGPTASFVPGNEPAPTPAAETDVRPVAGLSTERSVKGPGYYQAVARLGAQAAEALEHAHQLGVVHRDIKPGNLMVDGRGNLWVTDFGLAQVHSDTRVTMTGDVIGTLRYMSPEQALAQHGVVDHRTDVYSLGVTLYELVTLRPAVDGSSRGEVLRKILDGESPRPRRLNPAVPVDLETILLKAMAREPESRYATAQGLADDLRRFLDDRPIAARRPGLAYRAARWARRHRALVGAATVVLVLAVAVLVPSLAYVGAELHKAEGYRNFARRAADDFYTDVAEGWLEQEPGLEDLQRQFLLKALEYYQEFARDDARGWEVRFAAARAYRRIGDIQQRLEALGEAERAYAEAAGRLHRLAGEFPARREVREELAGCRHAEGNLRAQTKRHAEAEASYREAVSLWEQLRSDAPDPVRASRDLGVSVSALGRLLQQTGRSAEAAEAYDRAVVLLDQPPDRSPKGMAYESHFAATLVYLAEIRNDGGRLEQARQLLRRSIEHRRAALKGRPRNPTYRRTLAEALTRLAGIQTRLGEKARAEDSYLEALAIQDRLADDFPMTALYRAELARVHTGLADLLHTTGRSREAVESYHRAADQWGRLVHDFPSSPGHARDLAWLLATCPQPSVRDPAGAVEWGRRAVSQAPRGGDCRRALGAALVGAGDWRGAIAELDQAVALRSGGDGREWLLLSLAHARLGEQDRAREWYDRSVKWLEDGRAEDATLHQLQAEVVAALGGGLPSRE
jgi:serine/threonine protein kinase/tetratricopeptide (TPR) repeat protein